MHLLARPGHELVVHEELRIELGQLGELVGTVLADQGDKQRVQDHGGVEVQPRPHRPR